MFTVNQLRTLAASAEFQRLLAEDPHLRELEDSQYDRRDEYLGLRNALRFSFSLGPLELHPPTPALWAYLWATGNAYASDFEHADDLDTDIAVFLLSRKWEELQRPPAEIAAAAIGFCGKNGIDYGEAGNLICELISQAFRPLRMLPEHAAEKGSAPPAFDIDWLTRLCSTVARESNESASRVMFEMSLAACCFYFIQAMRRKNPGADIRRRSNAELRREIYEYTMHLAEEYLRAGGR